jgi:hypothetical protein
MNDEYEEIKQIIANSLDIVDFADFGDGISEEWIEKAESRLGINLPNSYKWWLKNYNGGEICGQEIFSIYGQDFDTVVGGDIVYMHELNQKKRLFAPNKLVICESDDDVFYFDINQKNEIGEYPVYSGPVKSEYYAKDFLEFLKKRIMFYRQ